MVKKKSTPIRLGAKKKRPLAASKSKLKQNANTPSNVENRRKSRQSRQFRQSYQDFKKLRSEFLRAKWKWAVRRTIKNRYLAMIEEDPKVSFPHERLSKLHYEDEDWADSITNLSAVIKLRPNSIEYLQLLSSAHVKMFRLHSNHDHLKLAHKYLKSALTRMQVTVFTVQKYPSMMFDFARTYETFGSFEGALEMYGHIMELFPKYDKYQLVLFRSAVIMVHMSGLANAPKVALLNKAKEMVDLIYSSSPDASNLNREHVCILYFRMNTKMQGFDDGKNSIINGAQQEVFSLRKSRKVKGYNKFTSYLAWKQQPHVFKILAEEFADCNEPTLSVDMYDECIRLMQLSRKPTLSISFLLDIATQYSLFQEFDTAITYAQGAWMMDRFDERARTLLSQWSEDFKWYFTAQVKGASRLQMKWRTRIWSRTYYYRYHKICVDKWEAKLRRKHFDMKTREKLAYFARSKWRGLFLYEEQVATKIQRFYRSVMAKWVWMSAKRDAHLRKLASTYAKWRRDRYNLEIREQCVIMANNNFTPPTHNMKKLPEQFDAELKACICIQKASRVWHAKAVIKDMMEKRAEQRRVINELCAFMIQMEARRYIARMVYKQRLVDHLDRVEAATFLQQYWRNRKNTMEFVMKLLKEKRDTEERELKTHMINRMIATWRMIVIWRKIHVLWRMSAVSIEKVYRGHVGRKFVDAYKCKYASLIQRAWNGKVQRDYLLILVDNLRAKQKQEVKLVTDFVTSLIKSSVGENQYSNPSLNSSSVQFKKMKMQTSVIYERETHQDPFTSVDAHLLANLLRHPECQIQTLALSRASLGDKVGCLAIANAMETNRSVKTVGIVDSDVGVMDGIDTLIHHIRRTNFNIEKLSLERMGKKFGDVGGKIAADLIGDFFVLQFGNLLEIFLNSNCITDASAVMIGDALAINKNLQLLELGDNQISDAGAVRIAEGLKRNSSLKHLNLNKNYIQVVGGETIAKVLVEHNETLTSLDISDNLMTDAVIPLFREMVEKNNYIVDFDFSGNVFRRKYAVSIESAWADKVQKREDDAEKIANALKKGKRLTVLSDGSLLDDEEETMTVRDLYSSPSGIRRRAKKKSPNKLSPSFKKILRSGVKSIMEGTESKAWSAGVGHPRRAVKIGAFYSPQGKGFMGDHNVRLEPLPYYRKDGANTTGGKRNDAKKNVLPMRSSLSQKRLF